MHQARHWILTAGLLALLAALPAAASDFRLLKISGLHVKWGEPALGEGAEVSYGLVQERISRPDAINCGEVMPITGLMDASRIDQTALDRAVRTAFSMWSTAANLVFRPARADETPDILIGAQAVPSRIAFANVWLDAARANDGVAPMTNATICFNPWIPWSLEDNGVAGLDFTTVLAHEIGHAIGLDHPGATGSLMGFQDQGEMPALMAGDVAGAVTIYGPKPRPGRRF